MEGESLNNSGFQSKFDSCHTLEKVTASEMLQGTIRRNFTVCPFALNRPKVCKNV